MIMLRKKPPNSEFEFGTYKKTPKFRIWICMLYFHNTNSNSEFVSPNLGHKFRIWICLFLAVQPYMVFYSKNWSLQSQRLAQFVGKYETKKEIYPNNMQSMYLSYTKYITLFCNFVFFSKTTTDTYSSTVHTSTFIGRKWLEQLYHYSAGWWSRKKVNLPVLVSHVGCTSSLWATFSYQDGCLWRLHFISHVGYTFENGQSCRLPLKATFE